ncbi:hypothetical protein EG328_008835 [Venturia inaequalis]|uniref:Survival factor 1 n=1 Tax=Venturia inaequalis TaxID=5025 RepID=A0A8H3V965_VENIN|nr:hypothetical protein EG328_008835 [Venturia inaequalis]
MSWGNWGKQLLANVAGTQEPIYGPTAIQPVKSTDQVPYTEITKEDLKWKALSSTSVETQTFYFTTDSGHIAFAQVIYSNVASKIFYPDGVTPPLFATDAVSNHRFDKEKYNFYADNVSVELSADGNTYTIKSSRSTKSIVNITITKLTPGFVVGKNGKTNYGENPAKPWGHIRHAFWPRCQAKGSFMTPAGEVSMDGRATVSHAMQAMKPHHAASTWNFVNFQSPNYSAILMEFTTPPSYGKTTVAVGGITSADKIIYAGSGCTASHIEVKGDPEVNWPEPSAGSYSWKGKGKDGTEVDATLIGPLGPRRDRIDIMAEVPKFVKSIVASAAGTRPYIYQFTPKLTLKLKIGDKEIEEEGTIFTEATFIS